MSVTNSRDQNGRVRLTLEAEVREQGNVLGALLALCQLGEYKETLEASA